MFALFQCYLYRPRFLVFAYLAADRSVRIFSFQSLRIASSFIYRFCGVRDHRRLDFISSRILLWPSLSTRLVPLSQSMSVLLCSLCRRLYNSIQRWLLNYHVSEHVMDIVFVLDILVSLTIQKSCVHVLLGCVDIEFYSASLNLLFKFLTFCFIKFVDAVSVITVVLQPSNGLGC